MRFVSVYFYNIIFISGKRKVLNIEETHYIINNHLKNNVSVQILSQTSRVGFDILKNKDKLLKFCSESDSVIGFQNRTALKSAEEYKFDFASYEWFRQERFKEEESICGLRKRPKYSAPN